MTRAEDSSRLISADSQERSDNALRPTSLAEFIGQGNGRRNLETFIHAARDRGDAMDHSLLHRWYYQWTKHRQGERFCQFSRQVH